MRGRRSVAILAILALAALLRFPNLTQHDVADDEALMAFRSVGWLDTWFGSLKSPLDLFPTEQWWQKFSFHDHPPLVFFVEHQFFRLFGPTVAALRLPFAIAGVVAVWLTYLVGRALFGYRAGVGAAAAMAAANSAVWLSRVGFQEGLLVMWMLATLWFFLRSFDNPRYLIGVGAGLGLSFLTKYSAVVLLPVIVGGYVLFAPKKIRPRWAVGGLAAAVFCLTPVILYNAMLFKTRGHFDATLWAMLGQSHADFAADKHAFQPWSALLDWWHWMAEGFGWPLMLVALAGIAALTWQIFADRREGNGRRAVLPGVASGAIVAVFLLMSFSVAFRPGSLMRVTPVLAILGYFLVLLWWLARRKEDRSNPLQRGAWIVLGLFGATFLFLCLAPARKQYAGLMVIPVALAAGYLLSELQPRLRGGARGMALAGLLLVVMPTANGQLRMRPDGAPGMAYLALRPTSVAYRQLDRWLDRLYQDQPPALQLTDDPQVSARMERMYVDRYGEATFNRRPPMVIWDDRMDFATVRWTMMVRNTYLFQPTLNTMHAVDVIRYHGLDFLETNGFNDFYFIFLEPSLAPDDWPEPDGVAIRMRHFLEQAGYRPEYILDPVTGQGAFAIFRTDTFRLFPAWNDSVKGG